MTERCLTAHAERASPEDRTHRDEKQVGPSTRAQGGTSSEPQSNSEQSRTIGPDHGNEHPKGLARAVLEVENHCVWPEGCAREEYPERIRVASIHDI